MLLFSLMNFNLMNEYSLIYSTDWLIIFLIKWIFLFESFDVCIIFFCIYLENKITKFCSNYTINQRYRQLKKKLINFQRIRLYNSFPSFFFFSYIKLFTKNRKIRIKEYSTLFIGRSLHVMITTEIATASSKNYFKR